mgnify:FL=1
MQGSTVKLQVLSRILGRYRKQNQEFLFSCPACEHRKKKLSVNVEKNKFQCWTCGFSGSTLSAIVKKYGEPKDKKEWLEAGEVVDINDFYKIFEEETEKREEVVLPEEYICLVNEDVPRSALMAKKYLKERGVTRDDILLNKIGYCATGEYARRVIVPSFDIEGEIDYFIARSYTGDFLKYKNPKVSRNIVFNDLYINWNDDIVLVEGVFDAIRAGYNTIPLLGSTLNVNSVLFSKIVNNDTGVYLALDPDAHIKENKIAIELMKYGIDVYKIEIGDYEDVAEMPKDVFERRKTGAQRLDREGCMLNYVFYA